MAEETLLSDEFTTGVFGIGSSISFTSGGNSAVGISPVMDRFARNLSAWDLTEGGTTGAAVDISRDIFDPPLPPVWPVLMSSNVVYGRENPASLLVMTRGDQYVFDVQVVKDGLEVDITDAAIKFTAAWPKDRVTLFQLTVGNGIVKTEPTRGIFQVTISPAMTSGLPRRTMPFLFDIEVTLASGGPYTVASGVLLIREDVS